VLHRPVELAPYFVQFGAGMLNERLAAVTYEAVVERDREEVEILLRIPSSCTQ
jgi:hypothetical protein